MTDFHNPIIVSAGAKRNEDYEALLHVVKELLLNQYDANQLTDDYGEPFEDLKKVLLCIREIDPDFLRGFSIDSY